MATTLTVDTSTCSAVKARINRENGSKRRDDVKNLKANMPKDLNWKHIAKILKG